MLLSVWLLGVGGVAVEATGVGSRGGPDAEEGDVDPGGTVGVDAAGGFC